MDTSRMDGAQISIHTLRMEGDVTLTCYDKMLRLFQSTPSAWRVTVWKNRSAQLSGISIHTLRMEGDGHLKNQHTITVQFQSTPSAWRVTSTTAKSWQAAPHFNPHPPHGG